MKKILKLLILLVFLGFETVKADHALVGIDTNYTTVYKGDTINMSLGFDYLDEDTLFSDAAMFSDECISDTEDYCVKMVFSFDDNIFEINDKSEYVYSNHFKLDHLEKKDNEDGSVTYIFYLLLEYFNIEDTIDDSNDVVFNNTAVSNIKLKIKNDVEVNRTYYIKSGQFYTNEDDDGIEYSEFTIDSILPITVIDSKKTSKTISKISTCNPIWGVLAYCDTRCKITGIGNEAYSIFDYDNATFTLNIKYDNEDKIVKKSIDANTKCEFDSDYYFFIVGFDDEKIDDYYNILKNNTNSDKVKIFKYNYNKIDNATKDMIDFASEIPTEYYKSQNDYITSLYYFSDINISGGIKNRILEKTFHYYELDENTIVKSILNDDIIEIKTNDVNNDNNENEIIVENKEAKETVVEKNNDIEEKKIIKVVIVVILLIINVSLLITLVILNKKK